MSTCDAIILHFPVGFVFLETESLSLHLAFMQMLCVGALSYVLPYPCARMYNSVFELQLVVAVAHLSASTDQISQSSAALWRKWSFT